MSELFEKRINELRKALTTPQEAALLTNEVNIGYFCGFFHSEGYLVVTQEKVCLLVDFRYIEAAQKKAQGCEVRLFHKLSEDLLAILTDQGIACLHIEASHMTVAQHTFFRSKLEKENITVTSDNKLTEQIENIRIIKDASEAAKIRTAQQIAEKAYLGMLNHVKAGVTERELAARLEYYMKQGGAEDKSFDLITITGKKTSLPHGVPSDDVIREGDFFTCDFGAVYEGYRSDTTRTVAVGHADDEMRKIYSIVLEAQLAALSAVKADVSAKEVDKIARDIIANAGYGEYFGHSTGHGVGLDIHEAPAVSPRETAVLRAGMVITDEPGIYLPDRFGVRIEDMLLVTQEGCENFVSLPKDFIIL